MKDTSLLSEIETFKTLLGKQSKICLSFIALLSRMQNRMSCTINTTEELVIDVSLVVSVRLSQEEQNHLFWEDDV